MKQEKLVTHDGTTIGFYVLGKGPGLVLVQGAMGTASTWTDFAIALSESFTVYVPDRRGRGLSPCAFEDHHGLTAEVEDLRALLEFSQSRFVFGLSSGAVIALYGAAVGLAVDKIIAYEPPLFTHNNYPQIYVDKYFSELGNGRLLAAFYSAGCAVNPRFRIFPQWLFELVFPVKKIKTIHGHRYDEDFESLVRRWPSTSLLLTRPRTIRVL